MRPLLPRRDVGHPFWRARVCSWLYLADSFCAVVWLALCRTSVFVFTCAPACMVANRDNKRLTSKNLLMFMGSRLGCRNYLSFVPGFRGRWNHLCLGLRPKDLLSVMIDTT